MATGGGGGGGGGRWGVCQAKRSPNFPQALHCSSLFLRWSWRTPPLRLSHPSNEHLRYPSRITTLPPSSGNYMPPRRAQARVNFRPTTRTTTEKKPDTFWKKRQKKKFGPRDSIVQQKRKPWSRPCHQSFSSPSDYRRTSSSHTIYMMSRVQHVQKSTSK